MDPDLLAAAMEATATFAQDPLKASGALRRQFPSADPTQISAALTQARLRRRAQYRLGSDAAHVLLTEAGLEQATRAGVAQARAQRLARTVHVVADLGCGIGTESWAMARAGLTVIAVEKDPATADLARYNAKALGLAIEVIEGDVTDENLLEHILGRVEAVFVDPARRQTDAPRTVEGIQQGRLLDPEQWSPPLSFVKNLAQRIPTVAKVAPGIDLSLISDAEVVFTSDDGDLVEASVWFAPLGNPGTREAVVKRKNVTMRLTTNAPRVPMSISTPRAFVLDPDDAIVRADVLHMVAELHGALLDPHIAWLTTDQEPDSAQSWLGTWYKVLDWMPFNIRELRWKLSELGIGNVTITKRGFAGDVEQMRKQLRLSGSGRHATVMLTRTAQGPLAVIAEQVQI